MGLPRHLARWIGTKLFSGRPPRLSLPGGARLGGWLSFSEYWSFQNIMPEAERLFMDRCLTRKPGENRTAVDIGANVGAFTCYIASLGPHTVHAFEGYSGNLVGRNPKRRLLERKSMESAAWVVSWQGGLRFVSEMRQVALCRTFALVGAGV